MSRTGLVARWGLALLALSAAGLCGCKKEAAPSTSASQAQPASGVSASASTMPATEPGAGGRIDVDFAALPVGAQATGDISPTGGVVALQDGTRVRIPAGALDRQQRVTLRSRASEPRGPVATITEIDAPGVALKQDAVLTMPCPKLPGPVNGYRVLHYHNGQITELPAKWDRASNVVEARCREFSNVTVTPADPDTAALNARMNAWAQEKVVDGGGPVPPLAVPYYYQGMSQWCWAACAQMMLKAYGKDVEIWDLARWNRSRFEAGKLHVLMGMGAGLGDFWQVTGSATAMFTDRQLPVEHFRLPWSDIFGLYNYLVENLRDGRPVMMTISNFHVVVVVGCDADGFFVHDPSGALVELIDMLKGKNTIADNGKLAAIHVSWNDLRTAVGGGLSGGLRLGLTWTTCIPAFRAAGSPATVELMYNNLIFSHPDPRPRSVPHPNAYFTWDGTVEGGYRFCFDCGDDAFTSAAHTNFESPSSHIRPLYATMSDTMFMSVSLHNPTAAQIDAAVTATLGGKPLAQQPFHRSIPARATNIEASFVRDAAVGALGLEPGTHRLRVDLNANNAPADAIELDVKIGPSQVKGLQLKHLPDSELLAWKPVPEKDVEYSVYRLWYNQDTKRYSFPSLRQTAPETQFKFEPLKKDGADTWWFVVARHVPSKLEGPPSDYVLQQYHDPIKAGFLPEDIGAMDAGFGPAAVENRPQEACSPNSIRGSCYNRDKAGGGGMSWSIYKMLNADEARRTIAGDVRSYRDRIGPGELQLARTPGHVVTDGSHYSDTECLFFLHNVSTFGTQQTTKARVESTVIYRDIFVITFGRSEETLIDKKAAAGSDKAKRPEDYLLERQSFIKRSQGLIDMRFPPVKSP